MTAQEAKSLSMQAVYRKRDYEQKMKLYFDAIKKACDKGEYSCKVGNIPYEDKNDLKKLGFKIRNVTAYGRGAYGEDEYDTYISWEG